MNRTARNIAVSLALVVLQTTIVRMLSLEGIVPDLLIIWVVYIALTEGQLHGTVWGFCIGLCADILSGSFLGLSAMTKTVSGFVGGYFFNDNKTQLTLGTYRFLLIVLSVSFLHNLLYFIIFTQGSEIRFWEVVFKFGITTTLYTATVCVIPMFAFSRRLSL